MDLFVLKLVGIICVTIFAIAVLIVRKDDISCTSVIIAVILEIVSLCIVYMPFDQIIPLIEKVIK